MDNKPRLMRTVYHLNVGDRVRLHPHAVDAHRYPTGTVEAITRNGKLRIRMDESGTLRPTDPLNVLEVVSRACV